MVSLVCAVSPKNFMTSQFQRSSQNRPSALPQHAYSIPPSSERASFYKVLRERPQTAQLLPKILRDQKFLLDLLTRLR